MNSRSGFTIPMPKPGDGTKIFVNPDGSLSCSWDKPRMAMDAAINLPPPQNTNSPFDSDPEGDDLADKVHQLLDGKLDPGDIEELIDLITGGSPAPQPTPAQDRGRFAHDQRMPSAATMRRLVAESMKVRGRDQHRNLIERFPALKNARVVG